MLLTWLVLAIKIKDLEGMMLNGKYQKKWMMCFQSSKPAWTSLQVKEWIGVKQFSDADGEILSDYAILRKVCKNESELFNHMVTLRPKLLLERIIASKSIELSQKTNLVADFRASCKIMHDDWLDLMLQFSVKSSIKDLFVTLRNEVPELAARHAVNYGSSDVIIWLLEIAKNSHIDVHIQNYFRLLFTNTKSKILVDFHIDISMYYSILKSLDGNEHCKLLEAYAVRNPNFFNFAKEEDITDCKITGLYPHQTRLALVLGATENTVEKLVSNFKVENLQGLNERYILSNLRHGAADQFESNLYPLIERVKSNEGIKNTLKLFYDFENCNLLDYQLRAHSRFYLTILKYGLRNGATRLNCVQIFATYYASEILTLDLDTLKTFYFTDPTKANYVDGVAAREPIVSIMSTRVCDFVNSLELETAKVSFEWLLGFYKHRAVDNYELYQTTTRHLVYAFYLKANREMEFMKKCQNTANYASQTKEKMLNLFSGSSN
eukprot:NODE_72_length_24857_cov_0.454399.p1 type:complete len:493 gc:universal NODE_72_length_24857_cov_0.454399:15468-16946(+)